MGCAKHKAIRVITTRRQANRARTILICKTFLRWAPFLLGKYTIGSPHDTLTHGPFVLPLQPDAGNQMFGRTGFLIHGDSVVEPGTASRGCIILSRAMRNDIALSGDKSLRVMSGIATDTEVA